MISQSRLYFLTGSEERRNSGCRAAEAIANRSTIQALFPEPDWCFFQHRQLMIYAEIDPRRSAGISGAS